MSNIQSFNQYNGPAVLPEGMADEFQLETAGFESERGGVRFLKPRKADFLLRSGDNQTIIANGDVYAVLLAVSKYKFCTWYRKEWSMGQEPSAPDLQWVWRDESVFPDALPEEYRKKVLVNGQMRWKFRQAVRSVWGLATFVDNAIDVDVDNPVILDITSQSLYGEGDPRTNSYKWSGVQHFCRQTSMRMGVKVLPNMFLTQINIDLNATTSGVVVFRVADNSGACQWLPQETMTKVWNACRSDYIKNLVDVNEYLGEPEESYGFTDRIEPAPQRPESKFATDSLLKRANEAMQTKEQADLTTAHDDMAELLKELKY